MTITDPAVSTDDSWNVNPAVEADFEITFEAAAGGVGGVFTAVKDGLSFVAFGCTHFGASGQIVVACPAVGWACPWIIGVLG